MWVRMEIGGLHEEDIKYLEREGILEEARLELDGYHYKAIIKIRL